MQHFRRKRLAPNHAALQVKQSQNLNCYVPDDFASKRVESQSAPRSKPRWRKAVVRMHGVRAPLQNSTDSVSADATATQAYPQT